MIVLEVATGIQSNLSQRSSDRGRETGGSLLFKLPGSNIPCGASQHFKSNKLGTLRDHCRSIFVSQMLLEPGSDMQPPTPTTSHLPEMKRVDGDKVMSWR